MHGSLNPLPSGPSSTLSTLHVDNDKLIKEALMLLCCAGPALQEAYDSGLSVIVKEGMANGRVLQGKALDGVKV